MYSLTRSHLARDNFEVGFMRWTLVLIFGYSKWFAYEVQALIPLISNRSLLSWMHTLFGIQGASFALGVTEWTIGLGLAFGTWSPRMSLVAAAGSTVTYLTTITLIVTTPGGWEASARGFPAPGGETSFLVKDVVLLVGSILLLKQGVLDVMKMRETQIR